MSRSEKGSGLIVRLEDGRLGIAYKKDQKMKFKGREHPMDKHKTVLVTMISETFSELDEPKRVVKKSKLSVEGLVD